LEDKAKERTRAVGGQARREACFRFLQHPQSVYEILSPDAFLRRYLDDYQALAAASWASRRRVRPTLPATATPSRRAPRRPSAASGDAELAYVGLIESVVTGGEIGNGSP
jgi:hypothetical protein